MKSVKSLLWLFSVLYLGILCVLWASPYWPSRLGWLANLFQMAPLWVLYFPLGFLFIIWLFVRKTGILIVNIVSFAVIFFCIMGFNVPFSVPWQKAQNAQDQLRIMTFNLGTNVDATSLAEFIAKVEPDIIAFQEVYTDSQNALKLILPQDEGWYLSFQQYLGLASRLKIRNVDVKNRSMLGGRGEMVAKYELELEGENNGYINFFNVHLETPRDGLEAVIDNKMGGVSEVRRVAELQKKESGFISEWIESHDAVLIAGDFNMLEISPLYKKYWSSFTNAFLKTRFGFGYTYYTSWHGVRIDRILCGEDWKVIDSQVGPDMGSEHRPVIADVEFIGIGLDEGLRDEEIKEVASSDTDALILEKFEFSLGKFEDYDTANITVDNKKKVLGRNALKVERKGVSDALHAGIQLDSWRLESYPMVSFLYMIPEEIPLGIRVKTIYNDWISLGGTEVKNEFRLIDDGEWHKIDIDVCSVVKEVLPSVKYLKEFQFYIHGNRYQKDTFWIDDFRIGK